MTFKINLYIAIVFLLALSTSCDKEKRRLQIHEEAQREIVQRDSIYAEIKSAILEQEYREASITNK